MTQLPHFLSIHKMYGLAENNMEERYENLIQMICESKADFIWLQEVLEPFLKQLLLNKYISKTYYHKTILFY